MEYNGVINVYKEKAYTSHDVVYVLRRELKVKTGHTGTLDPNAVGVLPVCLGRSTKLADYIADGKKKYRAEVNFGVVTDTLDMTGVFLKDNRPQEVKLNDFQQVLEEFTGNIAQIPPMYSAIKINGEKLYNLARKGVEIERSPRNIVIYSIDIFDFKGHTAIIDVECSKGTYIRSLVADIGERLGVGAAMGELIRLRSGNFCIESALTLDKIKELHKNSSLEGIVKPPEEFFDYSSVQAVKAADRFILNGNAISIELVSGAPEKGQKYKLFNHAGKFIGIYALTENNFLKSEVILVDLQKIGEV